MSIRILVVDDHASVRRGIKTILEAQPGWEVVDEATDGTEAVNKAEHLGPDLVVMDLSMPRMGGLEASRIIRGKLPETQVVVVTQHDSAQMMREAKAAGAIGYVVKSNVARDLVRAVMSANESVEFGWPSNLTSSDSSAQSVAKSQSSSE